MSSKNEMMRAPIEGSAFCKNVIRALGLQPARRPVDANAKIEMPFRTCKMAFNCFCDCDALLVPAFGMA